MPLSVDIVSPNGTLFSGEAEHVSLMTVEGSIGLYPAHEPILSVLQACSVGVALPDGKRIDVPIGGGFVSFDSDRVTVVADPPGEEQ
jgi:F-type H+-transporting ATPase subunit epsilon